MLRTPLSHWIGFHVALLVLLTVELIFSRFGLAALDAEARARRRWLERAGRGEAVPLEEVAAEMALRDARDAARDVAPMRPAEDALLLDTTELDADAAFREAWMLVQARLSV